MWEICCISFSVMWSEDNGVFWFFSKLLLRKFVKEVADSDGEGVSNKDPFWNYLWHPKAFRRNCRKQTGCVAD